MTFPKALSSPRRASSALSGHCFLRFFVYPLSPNMAAGRDPVPPRGILIFHAPALFRRCHVRGRATILQTPSTKQMHGETCWEGRRAPMRGRRQRELSGIHSGLAAPRPQNQVPSCKSFASLPEFLDSWGCSRHKCDVAAWPSEFVRSTALLLFS